MGLRGTTNTNTRGSAETRRRRKRWLLSPDSGFGGDGQQVQCQFPGCETMVTFNTIWVDRWPIPGSNGGRYVRGNIRPSCGPCNMSHGSDLSRCPEEAPVALVTVPTSGTTLVALSGDESGEVLQSVQMGAHRYARSGPGPRQWRWGVSVTHDTEHVWLPGHATKREALAAGAAWLRQRNVDPETVR